jgi:ADP-ribose pyrophosphatase YjhB (NUDIX family)
LSITFKAAGQSMKFCNHCGDSVTWGIPESEDRPRFFCNNCDTIHYQNPKLVVGTVLTQDDHQVLLCRRAIEPRKGFWTLPAGYLENGETMLQGALRETWEEAGAKVEDASLYHLFDVPHIAQVHVYYHARYLGEISAGVESLEVKWFNIENIPWPELAFPTVYQCLRRWVSAPDDLTLKEQALLPPRQHND